MPMTSWRALASLLFVLGAAPAAASAKVPAVTPDGMHGLGDATQVIEVGTTSMGSTTGTVRTYERVGDRWRIVRRAMPGYVGVHGLSRPKQRHSGDGTTPIGNYGFVYGFGSQADPGVKGFGWRSLVPGTCWAGTQRKYNRWVHRTPCSAGDENLWSNAGVAYRYAAVIDFNYRRPVYGRGSGIFLHVQKGRPTAGSVSLREADLVAVLRWMRPGVRILIGPASYLRSLKG
jgi:L,D-peptidoglycan transpeptidase YkuD (ErfK/YbiS/YcfS/YnhG family)